jgi:hypothetical protein
MCFNFDELNTIQSKHISSFDHFHICSSNPDHYSGFTINRGEVANGRFARHNARAIAVKAYIGLMAINDKTQVPVIWRFGAMHNHAIFSAMLQVVYNVNHGIPGLSATANRLRRPAPFSRRKGVHVSPSRL